MRVERSRATSGGAARRRYPLHGVFVIYCFISLLVAVGAFNANNNLLFWLFGLSLGMLLVSGIVSGTMMMNLRIERLGIDDPAVGAPVRVRYRVTNRSRWFPAFAVTIVERVDSKDAQEQRATIDQPPVAFAGYVRRGSSIEVEGVTRALTRGRLRLSGFDAVTAFPFGIIKKSLWHAHEASAIVKPESIEVPPGVFDRDSGRVGAGGHTGIIGRQGEELVGLREYVPGDQPRHVSWRASARRTRPGELVVRQHAEGAPRRAWVIVALSGADAGASETAIRRAAAALREVHRRGLLAGLLVRTDWGASIESSPRTGAGRVGLLLNDLSLLRVDSSVGPASSAWSMPRLPASDLVIRIDATGAIDSPSRVRGVALRAGSGA